MQNGLASRNTPLGGQVALITGASGGIGSAIAKSLAREGVSLALVGRASETLDSLVAYASGEKVNAISYPIDLGNDDAVRGLKSEIKRDLGQMDILVHCAGVFQSGNLEETPVEILDQMYRINLRAPYLLTRTMLPLLRKQKGQVVFINSSAVHFPRGTVGQYSASKSGLRAFSDSFREEVNRGGIRVLSLFVGRTATSMQKRIHETEGKAYQPDRLIQPADVAKIVTCTLTLPRTVEVTDIMLRPMGKPT